mgnify:CR=1
MNYFKNLFCKPQYVEDYETFRDYMGVSELPIYMDGMDEQSPALLGYVPRVSEVWADSDNVMVRLSYPMNSLVSSYKKDLFIQFNGTDICIAKKEPKQEQLYIPLMVNTYLDDQIINTHTYDVPVAYGTTHIVHVIPGREIALSAISDAESKYKPECEAFELSLKGWDFVDGELNIHSKLPDEIKSWANISTAGIPDDDHCNVIRYRPYPEFITDENGNLHISLHIDSNEARHIVETLLPSQRYTFEMSASNSKGIDELNVTRTIRTDQFPESYTDIKPFVDYLRHLGYAIDDDILYNYFVPMKGNGDSQNG